MMTQGLIIAAVFLTVLIADMRLRSTMAQGDASSVAFEPERLHADFMAMPDNGPIPEVPQPEEFTRMQQPLPTNRLVMDVERPPVCGPWPPVTWTWRGGLE